VKSGKNHTKKDFPAFFNLFYSVFIEIFHIFAGENGLLTINYYSSAMTNNDVKKRSRELIDQFCAGNDEAFSKLYDMYVNVLFNYGIKLTQDRELLYDCIHDIFVKVYNKRNEQNAINNIGSYLIISLKNRLLDEFRRQTFMTEESAENYAYRSAAEDVECDYLHSEREQLFAQKVSHLMGHLTRRQRQAITLYYLEERKYDEICQIMNMNYHSVRNLMHRSMVRLREAAM